MSHTLYYNTEFRAKKGVISGCAVPFGPTARIYKDGRVVDEQIMPGALKYDDVVLSRQHDGRTIMARTPGTLEIEEREDGLYFTARPPDTTLLRDTLEMIRSGVLVGSSIEFTPTGEQYTGKTRRITGGVLSGISIVSRPAYPDTDVVSRGRGRRSWRRKKKWVL